MATNLPGKAQRASYVLEVRVGTHTHVLRPAWAAPYFVVVVDDEEPVHRPLLIHCDDMPHARSHLAIGGVLFNSDLEQLEPEVGISDGKGWSEA